jgi:Rieske Fe-S protein
MADGRPLGRRRFVDVLLGGGVLASLASFVYPVLRFIMPPPIREAIETNVVAAKVGELAPNSGKVFKFGRRPALLVNTTGGELRAFDGICTHLNCTVQFRSDYGQIWCACHNGFYDVSGKNIAGPPPRPLERLQVQVRGDEVIVSRGSPS